MVKGYLLTEQGHMMSQPLHSLPLTHTLVSAKQI